MEKIKSIMSSSTGQSIEVIEWVPNQPKAIIQIVHGMAEHIERYHHFAEFLTQHQYLVVGHSHAGHGKTASIKGYFANQNGWAKLLDDMHTIQTRTMQAHPNLPYFIFGHSMGSFLVRCYLQHYSHNLQGAVVCATGNQPLPLIYAGLAIAKLHMLLGGAKKPCHILNFMTFHSFNQQIKNTKTPFDWISRDDMEVQKYLNDEHCGFVFTASAYADFFGGLKQLKNPKNYDGANKQLPILLVAGDNDPVGNMGKAVKEVQEDFLSKGFEQVECILYPEARHEILNELNKQEVYNDVLNFLNSNLN